MDRELVSDLLQHSIAGWVAPQNEIAVRDVLVSHSGVIDNARVTSKLLPPMDDGVTHFGLHPFLDRFMRGLGRRSDKDE